MIGASGLRFAYLGTAVIAHCEVTCSYNRQAIGQAAARISYYCCIAPMERRIDLKSSRTELILR